MVKYTKKLTGQIMKIKFINSLIVFLVIIFIFALNSCTMFTPAETTSKETSVKEQESKETEATTSTSKETETISKESASDQIKVSKPQPNQVVESPLIIEGEVRGTWFFEATFPVKLYDANGDIIATHFAQVQGEWMTEDFVSFTAQLVFEKPTTDAGVLI